MKEPEAYIHHNGVKLVKTNERFEDSTVKIELGVGMALGLSHLLNWGGDETVASRIASVTEWVVGTGASFEPDSEKDNESVIPVEDLSVYAPLSKGNDGRMRVELHVDQCSTGAPAIVAIVPFHAIVIHSLERDDGFEHYAAVKNDLLTLKSEIDAAIASIDASVTVDCKLCQARVPLETAHHHDGGFVGDACCWDDRLRSTE